MSTGAVVAVDPRHDPRWRALSGGSRGSLFTSPPWITAICDTYGFEPQARLLVVDGEAVGGFCWVPVDDLHGARLISLPFSDRAEPLVDDAADWARLRSAATAEGLPLRLRCLDDHVAAGDEVLRRTGEAAWHGTPLDGDLDGLHRRLGSTARRNIGAAERGGVRITVSSGLDAVRDFHRLHVHLRKHKYRLLAQPVELFEQIWKAFSVDDGIVVLLASVDDEVVAGALYLEWAGTLYYKFGASIPERLALRPNDALAWAALRLATERGLRCLDWGLSDLDQPGLVAYKRKWASVERRIATLRTPVEPPARPGVRALLADLTELLTADDVPDEVSARAGALLYRHFS